MNKMNAPVDKNSSDWIRPWHIEKFDDLYNRDERFFAILMKGTLGWLNENVLMYNRPIRHFIQDTGSAYLYVEKNGYEYSMNTTTGEDMIYSQLPRCIVEMSNITIPFEELTSPFVRGTYERRCGNEIKGYNAQVRRIPIEWDMNLHYYFSTFNEAIVVTQEIIDKLAFQHYFNITYLGNIIECSIEIPNNFAIELNKIDMTNPDPAQKSLNVAVKICSNYPLIEERSEIDASQFIASFGSDMTMFANDNPDDKTDEDKRGDFPEEDNTRKPKDLGKLRRFSQQ